MSYTDDELRGLIAAEIMKIAPEADLESVSANADFRRELEIDSFDFLRILIGLNQQLGVEIDEADYGKLTTLDNLVRHLSNLEQSSSDTE